MKVIIGKLIDTSEIKLDKIFEEDSVELPENDGLLKMLHILTLLSEIQRTLDKYHTQNDLDWRDIINEAIEIVKSEEDRHQPSMMLVSIQ